jgi:hypothetical protein
VEREAGICHLTFLLTAKTCEREKKILRNPMEEQEKDFKLELALDSLNFSFVVSYGDSDFHFLSNKVF